MTRMEKAATVPHGGTVPVPSDPGGAPGDAMRLMR